MSRARREFIHGRIADVLEHAIPPADVTTLAHHYARSNQPLKALPYLAKAGEQALRLRSYHEARQFGLQAVNLLGQLPGPRQRSERIDINLQLAQAYAFTGDMQRAIEILNETEHLAVVLGDELRLGRIFRRAAQFFWLRGQPETASDYARRTLRVAEELEESDLLYASLRMLGRVSIAMAAFDDAIAHLLRYVNIYDEGSNAESRSRPPEDLPIVLGYLGVAYSRVGAWERAIAVSERGLAMAEAGSGDSLDATTIFARMQLAMVQAGLHKWEECLHILSPIPETREFEDLTPPLYMVLSLRGFAQAQCGKTAAGIQTIQAAIQWAEQAGHRVFHYLPRQFLAESLFLAGKIGPALKEVKVALRDAQEAGNRWALGTALKLQADINTRLPSPKWTQIESDLIESMHLLRQIRARPDLARTYLSLRRLYDRWTDRPFVIPRTPLDDEDGKNYLPGTGARTTGADPNPLRAKCNH
jgi:tetratricopeptide (TPR) repeat protein